MENKFAKIPVASHGLHKHTYNYPWLSSINFGDVMPCYINTIRKGERDAPKGGVYSQLMPIAHNAFATGRYNFKAIFVPYKLVWRPWYNFDQQSEYQRGSTVFIPRQYPYVDNGELSKSIVNNSDLFAFDGTSLDFDISYQQNNTIVGYGHLTNRGRRVIRILGALGVMPSFVLDDHRSINILPIMCYLKAFADYYWPNNYVGNVYYRTLAQFFESEDINLTNKVDGLVSAIDIASVNFYENSVFDLAWDNPVTQNINAGVPLVQINDVTDPPKDLGNNVVDNTTITTPVNTPSLNNVNDKAMVGFTKYLLDALTSVSLWAKRHQLAGVRLLDRFLVSRGVSLPNDSARISYFIGQRNIEIQVSGVENNTDVNLGELAGRGIASSGNDPLHFECRPDDDGIFLIIVSPLPDANFPILFDGFSNRKDFLDNYTAEYDKLGAAAVPSRLIQYNLDGHRNWLLDQSFDNVYGFLNQYWDEVQERPRLLGDFILQSRGMEELRAYHTFRILPDALARHHSFDFVRMDDASQYQRLFYSEDQENLMLFLRWFGDQYKEKLPLGDSYDWDDDELNRRVSVVVGGSQK